MNTKTLSNRALSVIDQYVHLRYGSAVAAVPYFNNRTIRARAQLRTYIGKGSPKDITDEIRDLSVKKHIDPAALADESLKKLLVDSGIGIECSGFAYYVLNAESEERKRGSLDRHLSFVNCGGFLGKMRCALRPVENCSVSTLADDKNSRAVGLGEIQPGDMIVMTGGPDGADCDHVLIVHQVDYQNFVPYEIYYSHAIAYPEDGVYGSSIRQGSIQILDVNIPITEQSWTENGRTGADNTLYMRAKKSRTEVRRLRWW